MLIKNSPALLEKKTEQMFWLEKLETLNQDGLNKVGSILEDERAAREAEQTRLLNKTIEINQAYIEELQKVKPRLLKEWEASSRAEEKPDTILNNLNGIS